MKFESFLSTGVEGLLIVVVEVSAILLPEVSSIVVVELSLLVVVSSVDLLSLHACMTQQVANENSAILIVGVPFFGQFKIRVF